MCPNRVEELESRVQELEASVEGLTDELVECKVRIRELENAVDEDLGFGPNDEADETADIDTQPSVETDLDDGGELIEAGESPAETEAEATNTDEDDSQSNAEESDSDIIIA
jgi:hypothetical protein